MIIEEKPKNLSAEESSILSERQQQSFNIPPDPEKMSFRSNNNSDCASERRSRGFIATLFR
jgi:hypothetical protein